MEEALSQLPAIQTNNVWIEFDFDQEEGQGRGPTLEFYQLMAETFKKSPLWRKTDDHALFPAPEVNGSESVKAKFKLMGVLVGRCVMDNRIMPLNLSPVFWKMVLGRPLAFRDFESLDRTLDRSTFNL